MDLIIAGSIKEEIELSDLKDSRESLTSAVVVVDQECLIWQEIEIEAGNSMGSIDKEKANRMVKYMAVN